MKTRIFACFLACFFITACVSIPKETVDLSQTIGSDLKQLHAANRNMVEIHYNQIKSDINVFIDDVYAPFIINFVLKKDKENNAAGKTSLHGAMEDAVESSTPEVSKEVLKQMKNFLSAAQAQINIKRSELLDPIVKQEIEVLTKVNESYDNVIYANASITGHLKSIRKVKETQQSAMSLVGLKDADKFITNSLNKVSNFVNTAITTGKAIDINGDDALSKFQNLTSELKKLNDTKN